MPMADPRAYLFIDGGYLREIIRDFAKGVFGVDDPGIDLARIGNKFRRIFYYDCPPGKADAQSLADFVERMDSIKRLPGFHVFEGVVTGRRRTQKQVDVKIAVDMLFHTLSDNMDSATLLAGDQDFVPVLEALVRAGMYVSLLYEAKSGSRELIHAADEAHEITLEDLRRWCNAEFRTQYELPITSEMFTVHVDQRLALRRDNPDRWEKLADGVSPTGQGMRVMENFAQRNFIFLFSMPEGKEAAFTHKDASTLKRYLAFINQEYEITHAENRYTVLFGE